MHEFEVIRRALPESAPPDLRTVAISRRELTALADGLAVPSRARGAGSSLRSAVRLRLAARAVAAGATVAGAVAAGAVAAAVATGAFLLPSGGAPGGDTSAVPGGISGESSVRHAASAAAAAADAAAGLLTGSAVRACACTAATAGS